VFERYQSVIAAHLIGMQDLRKVPTARFGDLPASFVTPGVTMERCRLTGQNGANPSPFWFIEVPLSTLVFQFTGPAFHSMLDEPMQRISRNDDTPVNLDALQFTLSQQVVNTANGQTCGCRRFLLGVTNFFLESA
jgi:hypothetical protein